MPCPSATGMSLSPATGTQGIPSKHIRPRQASSALSRMFPSPVPIPIFSALPPTMPSFSAITETREVPSPRFPSTGIRATPTPPRCSRSGVPSRTMPDGAPTCCSSVTLAPEISATSFPYSRDPRPMRRRLSASRWSKGKNSRS